MASEVVPFRLLKMPCCGFLFCNVNHRLPSYCPECGTHVYRTIRECVLIKDERATLKYKELKP